MTTTVTKPDQYQPTIGIECHVQLKTKSKLFARVSNDAREAEPNTTVSAICFGLPGVLPCLNERALTLAVRAGIALNARINPYSTFDRKHYFYPDLPKGYQITQYAEPIVGDGWVEITVDGVTQKIGIERAHLEEDAGKLTHPNDADYSLVDLNRAGTPLLEIVSKPDIKSPAAAKAYARELYLLMKYAEVSDVDLFHGHLRFDVNISVSKRGTKELGTRTEVKNLNSFRAVEKAAQFELERQVDLLEKGQPIVQETRGWDEDKQSTFSQRSKEEAYDYRYFPEPDLPPVELTPVDVDKIRQELARLPSAIRQVLIKIGLDARIVESILDQPRLAAAVLDLVDQHGAEHAKRIALWMVNVVTKQESAESMPTDSLVKLSELASQSKVNSAGAKLIFSELMRHGGDPLAIAQDKQLLQVSDTAEIEAVVQQVIADNAKAAEDVRRGEVKAIGFLVGQVMKASKGQANPQVARSLLQTKISEGDDNG